MWLEHRDMFICRWHLKSALSIHVWLSLQRDNVLKEKDAAIESMGKQLGDARQSSQEAVYEREQQIANLKLELDKVGW